MHKAADRFLLQVEALLAGGVAQEDDDPPTPTHAAQLPSVQGPSLWSAGLPQGPSVAPLCVPPLWSHVAASLAPGGERPFSVHRGESPQSLPIAALHCGEAEDAKTASLQTLLVSLMAKGGTP